MQRSTPRSSGIGYERAPRRGPDRRGLRNASTAGRRTAAPAPRSPVPAMRQSQSRRAAQGAVRRWRRPSACRGTCCAGTGRSGSRIAQARRAGRVSPIVELARRRRLPGGQETVADLGIDDVVVPDTSRPGRPRPARTPDIVVRFLPSPPPRPSRRLHRGVSQDQAVARLRRVPRSLASQSIARLPAQPPCAASTATGLAAPGESSAKAPVCRRRSAGRRVIRQPAYSGQDRDQADAMNRKKPFGPIDLHQPAGDQRPGDRAEPVDEDQPRRGRRHVGIVEKVVGIGDQQRIERVGDAADQGRDDEQADKPNGRRSPRRSSHAKRAERRRGPGSACAGPSGPTPSRSDTARPARRHRSPRRRSRSRDTSAPPPCRRPPTCRTAPRTRRPAGTCRHSQAARPGRVARSSCGLVVSNAGAGATDSRIGAKAIDTRTEGMTNRM